MMKIAAATSEQCPPPVPGHNNWVEERKEIGGLGGRGDCVDAKL